MAAPPPPVPASPPRRSRWRRVARAAYLIAVVVAFTAAVVARREELADQLSGTAPGPLAAAVVAGVLGVGVSGLVWRRVLTGLGAPLPLRPAVQVFFVAQIGKYLPGSLWPVLAQAELGREHGVPRRSAVAAQTLFMWVHLVTGVVLGVPTLAATGRLPAVLAPVGLAAVVLLLPRPLSAVIDGLLRLARREPLPARPTLLDMAVATGWALLMWVLYGVHVHLLVDALTTSGASAADLPVSIGTFAAAWSAGFLFLVAPAGAGAREVVLVAGLGAVTAPDAAFAVALLSRLVLTLADGGWAAVGLAAGVGRAPDTPAG